MGAVLGFALTAAIAHGSARHVSSRDAHRACGFGQLHNLVHVWVGGHMGYVASPNDPVSFLHHLSAAINRGLL